MRRPLLASLAALALAGPLVAQNPSSGPPRPSPNASVSQMIGVTEVVIQYSSPGVKGRQIWGALVPWNQVCRTGANEATKFQVSTPVKVEGKPLPAGTYALFTVPGQDHWTVIFSNKPEEWGAFDYKPEDDVLRVDVKAVEAPMQERMTIGFADFDDTRATVVVRWEKLAVPFHLEVDTDALALEKAAKELAGTPTSGALTGWARWALEHGVATDKALDWATRAAAGDGAKNYTTMSTQARLLAKAGKKAEARAAATTALELAKTATAAAQADAKKLAEELASWK
jgi:hypothetical protein